VLIQLRLSRNSATSLTHCFGHLLCPFLQTQGAESDLHAMRGSGATLSRRSRKRKQITTEQAGIHSRSPYHDWLYLYLSITANALARPGCALLLPCGNLEPDFWLFFLPTGYLWIAVRA
jgi:hypothetical protein